MSQVRPAQPQRIVRVPFTQDEVNSLNGYQARGYMHPFTCGTNGCPGVLEARTTGWICRFCDYTQDWAHLFMANWGWKAHADAMDEFWNSR
jgi:hypothetical protein